MEKCSFHNYKKTLSIVLCLSYILQLPAFGVAHYFLKPSTNSEWGFLIGFWGINIFLVFLTDFFHTGMPKSFWHSGYILIFFLMSSAYFLTLYYRIYWFTILLTVLITIIIFFLRHNWNRKFMDQYDNKTNYSKEESIIRFSIYTLPAIFLAVVCSHIENILPHSHFSIFVRFIYSIIAFFLIAITYLLWYKKIKIPVPYNQLIPELVWLFTCFSVFVIGIGVFEHSDLTFLLPILAIIPILIRHKKT